MPRRPKGPAHRLAFANTFSPSEIFLSLLLAPATTQRRRASGHGRDWVEGAGFLLAPRKMRWRSEDTTRNFRCSNKCPRTSNAFSCEPRGSQLPPPRRVRAPRPAGAVYWRDEGRKRKGVEGEMGLAKARRCAGPFGRRGIARLLG